MPPAMLPAFLGLSGPALTADERAFFQEVRPAGYILFQRNCVDPDQLRALTDALRGLDGRDRLPILIDQEGGRVARLKPPHWPVFPAAAPFGALAARDREAAITAVRLNAQALGLLLADLGITVDCLPVLDVPVPGSHDVIGDRAFSGDPAVVAALGRAQLTGLAEAGVVGVIKHIPGHGRAGVDSHHALPVVEADAASLAQDLMPFAALSDAPMAMTAHVVYRAWDAERCATLSPFVIETVIRDRIGFGGLLMSDDLGMKALAGDFRALASQVLGAGCDIVLHCSGDLGEMQAVAAGCAAMTPAAHARLARAMAWPSATPSGTSLTTLAAARDALQALA
jgi:beta-N-acetylhexosaminidase